jgi:hypothetical protein
MPSRKDKPDAPAPKTGGRKKSKTQKPSFAIGGALPVEQRTGWVYRSEQAASAPSAPAAAAATTRPEPTPATPKPRKAPAAPAPGARNQWRRWIAEGAEAALFPLEVALVLALTPAQWLVVRGVKERK